MYFSGLKEFVAELERNDDLARIKAQVDPYLEAAAVINQVCKSAECKALLFENVKGSRLPLAANLYGSSARIAMAMGVEDVGLLNKKLSRDLKHYKQMPSEHALAKLVNMPEPITLSGSAPCFSTDATRYGLDGLPALHSWQGDGGRYITLGQVFTRHLECSLQNCGMYRVQVVDKDTALLRCHPGSGGESHLLAWQEQGKAMPVAIVLGGPPLLTWSAGVSLPSIVSEVQFASYLCGQPMAFAECLCSDLRVPASAEFVIEGEILPGEVQIEGPFGNHTGYYTPASLAPVLRIKRISSREEPVYPCTVVGPPPMESMYLAEAAEKLLLPLLKHDHSWVVDVHMPLQGIYHRAAFVAVDSAESSMAEIVITLRQSVLLKKARLLVLFDRDVDIRDCDETYWRLVNARSWNRSVLVEGNLMAVDTRRIQGEARVGTDPALQAEVSKRWPGYGLSDS